MSDSDDMLGEIRLFACSFTPTGWLPCDGRLLSISQNTTLFSLLGTYYGGDGKSTFALPNLQERVAIGIGQGPGLSERLLGDTGGQANVTLASAEMPQHAHTLQGRAATADDNDVGSGAMLAQPRAGAIYGATGAAVAMDTSVIAVTGGNASHENRQPYLVLEYCISTGGFFPPRS